MTVSTWFIRGTPEASAGEADAQTMNASRSLVPHALCAAAALGWLAGCGSNECLRMSKSANSAAEAVATAPQLDLNTPWTKVGEAQQKAAQQRQEVFRKAAAKASFSGVIEGPMVELNRQLADAYRGVAVGYEIWLQALENVGGKKDTAIKRARAALALLQAYNTICLSERPEGLPEPPPVPYGVPPKLNFIPCTPIDTAPMEGAMTSGQGLGAALDTVERGLTANTEIVIEKPKDYIEEALAAHQTRVTKAREVILLVQEAKAATAEVEKEAASLTKGAQRVQQSLDEAARLQNEIESTCGR